MARTTAPAKATPTSSPMFTFVEEEMVPTGVVVALPCNSPIAATTGVSDCRVADGIAVEIRKVLATADDGSSIWEETSAEVATASAGVGVDCCICEETNAEVATASAGVGEDCCICEETSAEVATASPGVGEDCCICEETNAEVATASAGVCEDCCICEETSAEVATASDGVGDEDKALGWPML